MAATPPPSSKPTPGKKAKLADALDAESRNIPSLQKAKTFSLGTDSSDSSLSDVDSDEFEDVSTTLVNGSTPAQENDEEADSESDANVEWEDAEVQEPEFKPEREPLAGGGIKITFEQDNDVISYSRVAKKGPSKQQKEVRNNAHKAHVQLLLFHNAIRNAWACDQTVQQTLVQQLPSQIKKEVDKWRRASGLVEVEPVVKPAPRKGKRGKQKEKANPREERDWGRPSTKLEAGKADMSNGDPLISLLKVLSAYWKKRFAITAPGLRKRGYGPKIQLQRHIRSFKESKKTGKHDVERHGEVIRDIKEFRKVAEKCEGSRDVGAQLFTALVRGLGIESRLVASLQPVGFGFTKFEDMISRKPTTTLQKLDSTTSEEDEGTSKRKPQAMRKLASSKNATKRQSLRKGKGNQDTPINLESDKEDLDMEEDDDVVDVTPVMPKQRPARYDRDMPVPTYWTEAISPVTSKVYPVDPLVLGKPVATLEEDFCAFEPKGVLLERVRVVTAYIVGYSSDGTAKDVTVRYLRKHMWPGKTKPYRYPVEKLAIHDKRGRLKRYEDYDWFKHAMSGYVRPDEHRTAVDDVEDSADLVAQFTEKKGIDTSIDSLASLKASSQFILERFLRREECIRPNAKVIRHFTVTKKGEADSKEPVYHRADVERCQTAESWHKEGMRPKSNVVPRKKVPVRAVTKARREEAEQHLRLTGEKLTQPLYAPNQTEKIIPLPIQNGIIPKNSFNNIDCFAPHMVPQGAVHLPIKGCVRICKSLDIDYAEAVCDFEFGNRMAVPVIIGVVVAEEHEIAVRDGIAEWNEKQRIKDEAKLEALTLEKWKKFARGLLIRERVGMLYGHKEGEEEELPTGKTKEDAIDLDEDGGTGEADDSEGQGAGGGFLLPHEDEEESEREELIMED